MAKKLYYKIGEACKILEIQPYVLRYWETEFPFLRPDKSKSGQRVYSDREINIIRRIKELLYEEGYTIAGAKKKLEGELDTESGGSGSEVTLKKESGKASGPVPKTTKKEAKPKKEEPGKAEAEAKLEGLRRGIESALRQSQEILEILRTDPST